MIANIFVVSTLCKFSRNFIPGRGRFSFPRKELCLDALVVVVVVFFFFFFRHELSCTRMETKLSPSSSRLLSQTTWSGSLWQILFHLLGMTLRVPPCNILVLSKGSPAGFFEVSGPYGTCPTDIGWLVITTSTLCVWEIRPAPPNILYSRLETGVLMEDYCN